MKFGLLVCAAMAVAPIASAQNLIINGSFEDSSLNPGGGWIPVGGGSGAIDGWTTIGNGVDYMGTLWPAAEGVRCLDINNVAPGGVFQSFATTAGRTYTVTFAMSANMFGGPALKTMDVSAGGSVASFEFDYVAEGATSTDPKWTYHEWQFVATGSVTTLEFASTTAGSVYGPAIDDIVVIPTPGSIALMALGLAGIGLRRRG
ncbi:MAG: choice-of-anchor C family protein [Leptolyngbya sp. PLA3]|nr:MAG: choice-of-anchor C family protein [Cyanobacteria bacterium CYA]MCE7969675.1 choice-of-anchor C family protein [Leptolyngbya sp. PL-A3]